MASLKRLCLSLSDTLKNVKSSFFDKKIVLSLGGLSVSIQDTANSKIFRGVLSIFATLEIKSLCSTTLRLLSSFKVNIEFLFVSLFLLILDI